MINDEDTQVERYKAWPVRELDAKKTLGVDCPYQRKAVSVSECERCARGYVVEGASPPPTLVLCPTELAASDVVVADLMSTKIHAVHADLPIERLILLLIDEDVSSVPVVDAERRPIGVVSKTDLVFDHYDWAELRDEVISVRRMAPAEELEQDLYLTELLHSHKVGDIMTGEPIVVGKRDKILVAAQRMAQNHVHSCPVVDEQGHLAGMITTLDVVKWACLLAEHKPFKPRAAAAR
jgi:CBS domain-containing protein